jgi:hypothetical protein
LAVEIEKVMQSGEDESGGMTLWVQIFPPNQHWRGLDEPNICFEYAVERPKCVVQIFVFDSAGKATYPMRLGSILDMRSFRSLQRAYLHTQGLLRPSLHLEDSLPSIALMARRYIFSPQLDGVYIPLSLPVPLLVELVLDLLLELVLDLDELLPCSNTSSIISIISISNIIITYINHNVYV